MGTIKKNCRSSGIVFVLTFILGLSLSCKKESRTLNLNGVNRWILDSMKVYYYWKDQLPAHPQDLSSANAFFKSLINPADRFSFLYDPDEDRKEYSSFAWYGFEYAVLENKSRPGELMAAVTLVVPDGPADRKGLKRGDIFTGVNGVTFTRTNMDRAAQLLRLGNGIELAMAKLVAGELTPASPINIQYSRFTEQPVYLTRVFTAGGRKTGYIFYNQFAGAYDNSMLQSLGRLRSEGVDELILDLRYNPGGDVSSAAKIAGVLSPASSGQTFVVYQGNSNAGRRVMSFQRTMYENSFQPQTFSELLKYRLSLNRVMVLTSGSTASAAELLINNLKPYTQIVQIGTATMGKDMASFAIADMELPKQTNIVLHPLVFKLFNAQQEGNYGAGLKPDFVVDEFAALPLKPLGDVDDPLIKKALEIAGSQATAVTKTRTTNQISTNLKHLSSTKRNQEYSNIEIKPFVNN